MSELNFCGLLTFSLHLLLIVGVCQAGELFEDCDHVYEVGPGKTFLASPNYPKKYPPFTSCRYKFVAPLDYGIHVECRVDMPKPQDPTSRSTQHFYVARDGDTDVVNAGEFSGSVRFETESLFRNLTLAYVSHAGKGRFNCSLHIEQRPCECGWSVNGRIKNGQEAQINEYPSAVALKDRTSNVRSFCGASIISHYFLLTAAQCTRQFSYPPNIVALVGYHDLTRNVSRYAAQYDIVEKIEHPEFSSSKLTYDLAILRTSKPIEWSRGVGPICLPPLSQKNNKFVHRFVDVIGWGLLDPSSYKSNTLQKARLAVTDNKKCEKVYSSYLETEFGSQICTFDPKNQGRDSCEQDTGGPVIMHKSRQFQIGCISYGKFCGGMGVNTRITSFLEWIHEVTLNTICNVEFK